MGLKLEISFIILAFLVFAMVDAIPNPTHNLMGSSSLSKRGLLDPIVKIVTGLLDKVAEILGRRK
ncbi:hypothetical protein Anas_14311 [Armadillidium nasatum]|uniref:Uncharacterized protein n=1 Tax=Armadillidium nasatum TaxID=96803 RepID=A0A5N5SN43_9CRUS|nr:hypothetical protein Anas_14311 [Armadillidium nasatum]